MEGKERETQTDLGQQRSRGGPRVEPGSYCRAWKIPLSAPFLAPCLQVSVATAGAPAPPGEGGSPVRGTEWGEGWGGSASEARVSCTWPGVICRPGAGRALQEPLWTRVKS